MIEHPLRYIATIGVFGYKGAGFMSDPNVAAAIGIDRMILITLNTVAILCLLGIFLGALVVNNQVLTAAFGLGAGSLFFMAMFTNALARFNAPITPLVILSLLWLLTRFVSLVGRQHVGTWIREKIIARLIPLREPEAIGSFGLN